MQIGPGGSIRAIHSDDSAPLLRKLGCEPPRRASHVEPIRQGPRAWEWSVDMSPLGPAYEYCLWPPSPTREAALAAEHDHIEATWINQ